MQKHKDFNGVSLEMMRTYEEIAMVSWVPERRTPPKHKGNYRFQAKGAVLGDPNVQNTVESNGFGQFRWNSGVPMREKSILYQFPRRSENDLRKIRQSSRNSVFWIGKNGGSNLLILLDYNI